MTTSPWDHGRRVTSKHNAEWRGADLYRVSLNELGLQLKQKDHVPIDPVFVAVTISCSRLQTLLERSLTHVLMGVVFVLVLCSYDSFGLSTAQVWNSEGTTVYSCSHDGSVGCLLAKKSVVSTFQPEDKKQPLLSLAVTPEGNGLLVGAVTSIFWIDIDTKVTLRSFASHCNGGVTSLSVIAIAPELPLFVLSAGNGDKDRLVSVWRLQEAETKEPDAMLNVNEVVRTISAARTDEGLAVISCVSRSGVLTCFQFDPASKRKKNKVIRPSATIQVTFFSDLIHVPSWYYGSRFRWLPREIPTAK